MQLQELGVDGPDDTLPPKGAGIEIGDRPLLPSAWSTSSPLSD